MEINEEHIKLIVQESVSATLLSLGLDVSNPIHTQHHMFAVREIAEMFESREFQADLAHLRKWRRSMDQISNVSIKTAISVIVTGVIGLLLVSAKTWLQK